MISSDTARARPVSPDTNPHGAPRRARASMVASMVAPWVRTVCVSALLALGAVAAAEEDTDTPETSVVGTVDIDDPRLDALRSEDVERLLDTLGALGDDPDGAAVLVDAIAALLAHGEHEVRLAALKALAIAGRDARAGVGAIARTLLSALDTLSPPMPSEHPPALAGTDLAAVGRALTEAADRETALALLWAVAATGAVPSGVDNALLRWGRDADAELRLAAIRAAGGVSEPGTALITLVNTRIDDPDGRVREAAVQTLLSLAARSPAARPFVDARREQARREAIAAVEALGATATAEEPIPAALARGLGEYFDFELRQAVVRAIARLGSEGSVLVDDLRLLLRSLSWERAWHEPRLRRLAAASGDVDATLRAVKSEDEALMREALTAISAIGAEAGDALPDLLSLLEGLAGSDRDRVIRTLGALGEAAVDAVPVLVAEVADRNAPSRQAAVIALGGVGAAGGDDAARALIQAMDEEHWEDRWLAAWALGQMGPAAGVALFPLIRALDVDDQRLRWAAVGALGNLGEEGVRALPEIRALLDVEESSVRRAVYEAMVKLAPDDPEVMRAVVSGLRDDDEQVRAAVEARLDGHARSSVRLRLTHRVSLLRTLRTEVARHDDAAHVRMVETLDEAIPILEVMRTEVADESLLTDEERADRRRARMQRRMMQLPLALYLLWAAGLGLIWGLRPTRSIRWDAAVRRRTGRVANTASMLTLLGPASMSSRTRKAWVARNAATVRRALGRSGWWQRRTTWVPVPLMINGRRVEAGDASALRRLTSVSGQRLLIQGAGGAGASALAAELGRRIGVDDGIGGAEEDVLVLALDLLPDDQIVGDGAVLLRRLLKAHDVADDAVSDPFLHALWASGQAVLIVDGIDTRSVDAQRAILAATAREATAVITARASTATSLTGRFQVEPCALAENELLPFVRSLLPEGGNDLRERTTEGCSRLAAAFAPARVPAGWAALLADLLRITAQHKSAMPPRTRGALALRYVHGRLGVCGFDEASARDLEQPLCALAWRAVQAELRPLHLSREQVMEVLAPFGDESLLDTLLGPDGLLVERAGDQIAFDMDPVAEHLAACHLVGDNADSAYAWNRFLADAALVPGAPHGVRGFLSALREWAVSGSDPQRAAPAEVLAELDRRLREDG